MSSMNRIMLIGAFGDDFTLRSTESGDSVANVTLVVDRPARENAPVVQDRFKVVAWRDTATQLEEAAPGDLVMIEGRVITRQEDGPEGRKYITEIDARSFKRLSGSQAAPSMVSSEPASPVFEPVAEPSQSADFDFSSAAGQSDSQLPPDFGKEVEEDVPF